MRYLLFILLFPCLAFAQNTGGVDYPYLGIKFSIPEGWVGNEFEGGYVMGSETEPGLIIMMTHEAGKLDQLKIEAEKGINEDGGTSFSLASSLDQITHEGVGGHFKGTLEYNPAEAYIGAIINPFGKGVTVMSITDPANYGSRQEHLTKEVLQSLRFAQPKENPIVKEWAEALKGAKLTYLSTSGGSDYSGYSSSSSREEILLCAEQFSFYSSYSASFDIDAGFGSANDSNSGRGTWKVRSEAEDAALILIFNDGRVSEYTLLYEEGKTFLSGSRYFRTYDHRECY